MTSLEHITALAIITCLATLLTLRRILSWKLIFGYAVVFDVSFTVLMLLVFSGTVSGAASATLAGLFLGVSLTIGKALCGYQRVRLVWNGISPHWVVTDHPGRLDAVGGLLASLRPNPSFSERLQSRSILYR